MITVNKQELLELDLIKLVIEKFNQDEISIDALLEIRNIALTANDCELFYTHKKAIDQFSHFIDEKINEHENNYN